MRLAPGTWTQVVGSAQGLGCSHAGQTWAQEKQSGVGQSCAGNPRGRPTRELVGNQPKNWRAATFFTWTPTVACQRSLVRRALCSAIRGVGGLSPAQCPSLPPLSALRPVLSACWKSQDSYWEQPCNGLLPSCRLKKRPARTKIRQGPWRQVTYHS